LYKNRDITEYGVLTDVATCLSNIRTDLDSFSNAEAYALMYSGIYKHIMNGMKKMKRSKR
jgi:hypothetical protein